MSETDQNGEALRRISVLLNVPVETFYEVADPKGDTGADEQSAAAGRAELITLYDALVDEKSKRLCRDLVRALAALERGAT